MAGYEKDFLRSFLGMHRQMQHLFSHAFHAGRAPSPGGEPSWNPPVDVFETQSCYIVKVEVAGIAREDVNVEFEDGQLTIEGCRHEFSPEARVSCRQMEIPYGHFRRTVFISRNVDGDNITAGYAGGFLEICLPRSDARRHRKVDIKVE
ncbi:MAG TPA: Hsp20/alpha crystallin family protein [Planctomycetota bacterium]|nr:Hsp20/alpha crystallin family protein [Planctomycetota bacterium]